MSFNIEEFKKNVTEMYSKGIELYEKNIQRYLNEIEKTGKDKIKNSLKDDISHNDISNEEIGNIIDEIEL